MLTEHVVLEEDSAEVVMLVVDSTRASNCRSCVDLFLVCMF